MNALGLIEVDGYLAAVEAADAALKAANVRLLRLEKVNAGITNIQITGDVGAIKAAVDAGALAAESLGRLRASHVIPRLHEETLKLFPSMNSNKATKSNPEEIRERISLKPEVKPRVGNSSKTEVVETEGSVIEVTNTFKKILEEKVDEEIEEEIEEIENTSEEIIDKAINEVVDKSLDNEIREVAEDIKRDVEEEKRNEIISSKGLESNGTDYNSMRVDELRSLVRKLNIPNMTNKQIKFAKKDALIKVLLEYGKEGEK